MQSTCPELASLSNGDAESQQGLTHVAVHVSTQAQVWEQRLVHKGDGDGCIWRLPSEPAAQDSMELESARPDCGIQTWT